jgi:hypothetical protein
MRPTLVVDGGINVRQREPERLSEVVGQVSNQCLGYIVVKDMC